MALSTLAQSVSMEVTIIISNSGSLFIENQEVKERCPVLLAVGVLSASSISLLSEGVVI